MPPFRRATSCSPSASARTVTAHSLKAIGMRLESDRSWIRERGRGTDLPGTGAPSEARSLEDALRFDNPCAQLSQGQGLNSNKQFAHSNAAFRLVDRPIDRLGKWPLGGWFGAESTPAGSLDAQAVSRSEPALALGGHGLPVQQVASLRSRRAAIAAGRRMPSALADQRVAHRLECLQLARDAVAAAVRTRPTAAVAHRELGHPDRIFRLEGLDRGV